MYIFLAFITGFSVLLTIIILGNLAERVGLLQTAFINYGVGALCAIIITLFTDFRFSTISNISPYMYLGGLIGILVTVLNGTIIRKIPAIYTTIIVFIGQVGTGLIIDYFRFGYFATYDLIGGIIIIIGLIYNIHNDKIDSQKIEVND